MGFPFGACRWFFLVAVMCCWQNANGNQRIGSAEVWMVEEVTSQPFLSVSAIDLDGGWSSIPLWLISEEVGLLGSHLFFASVTLKANFHLSPVTVEYFLLLINMV